MARYCSRSVVEDVEAALPVRGLTSSPLVMGRAVLVFAGAEDGRSVVAYHRAGVRAAGTDSGAVVLKGRLASSSGFQP